MPENIWVSRSREIVIGNDVGAIPVDVPDGKTAQWQQAIDEYRAILSITVYPLGYAQKKAAYEAAQAEMWEMWKSGAGQLFSKPE